MANVVGKATIYLFAAVFLAAIGWVAYSVV